MRAPGTLTAVLSLACIALAGPGIARGDEDAARGKVLDLEIHSVKHLDMAAEAVRDRLRRLVPGAEVECYGPSAVAVLGRKVERWAATRILWRLSPDRKVPRPVYPYLDPGPTPSAYRSLLGPESTDALERLQEESRQLETLLRTSEARYATGRVIHFVQEVDRARGRLPSAAWGSLTDEALDRLRVQFLRLELDSGRFLRRIHPYDIPDLQTLRKKAEDLLDHVNAVGRAAAHGWRPGDLAEAGLFPGLELPPPDLVLDRHRLETLLSELDGARGTTAVALRLRAYFEIAGIAHRLGFAEPSRKAEAARARRRAIADFVARVRRGVERLVR